MQTIHSNEKTGGILHRRTMFLQIMRQKTFESGYFTVTDIASLASLPRSTAQDWINRLLKERCIFVKEEQHGRKPTKYAARSALPSTTCRLIFTTVAGDDVEIFHECMSTGCVGFCAYHHQKAGGAVISVSHDGLLLRETAKFTATNPLYLDHAAVGLAAVERDGTDVIQTIRSIYGGSAYSLSEMMSKAKGVSGVNIVSENGYITGTVRTPALVPVTVGIDDTDQKGCGGATFALATALFKYITESGDAIGIRHQVAVLSPDIEEMTAGNSCSFLEFAVYPDKLSTLDEKICRFVADESVSENWGVALFIGIYVPTLLEQTANRIRQTRVSYSEIKNVAKECDVALYGKRGSIGAFAAVGLKNQPQNVLLDPSVPLINHHF